MTVREVIQSGVERLLQKNIETPYLDAAVLLAEAAQTTKERLYASFTDPVSEEAMKNFNLYIEKRLSGYPVSYIRNKKEFYGRTFYVDENVLVPRPDTEILVETALGICGGYERPAVLDLCTGSGCIAVTVACECGDRGQPVEIIGTDISKEAGEVYKKNARLLYGKELPFIQSDLFSAVKGSFDLILSNPPYVTDNIVRKLRQKSWPEPELALRGGEDGLFIIRKLIKKSVEYLNRNGYLLLEADPGQMDTIASLIKKEAFTTIDIVRDLANRNRVIKARMGNGTKN